MKKVLFTLDLGGNYNSKVTELTYPWIEHYARKIDAEFIKITERKFPKWQPTYEKLQMYDLCKQHPADWYYFIDQDAIIHPHFIDITNFINKDVVCHNANDFANVRFRYNEYFWRSGSNIGSCTWFIVFSDWCIDLVHPYEGTPEECYSNIYPIIGEAVAGVTPPRLVEDYILSLNIARYGLKFETVNNIVKKLGFPQNDFLCHFYAIPEEEKVVKIKQVLEMWRMV